MADLLVRVLDLLPGGVGELLFGVCGLRRHPLPAIIPASLPAQICSYVSFIIPFYGEIMFGVLVFLAFCGGAPVPPSSFLASFHIHQWLLVCQLPAHASCGHAGAKMAYSMLLRPLLLKYGKGGPSPAGC